MMAGPNIRDYTYQTSPNEKRDVSANARRSGDTWTVVIYDMDQAVGEKRGAQVALIFGRLLPKGYERETFAGKPAHKLDATTDRRAVAIRRDRASEARRAGRVDWHRSGRQGRLRGRLRRP